MRHYTYAHRRKDSGQVFYIGKGSGQRAWVRTGRSQYWHRLAEKHGYDVQILAKWQTEEEALTHEVFLIECFQSLNVQLCNLTKGGEGANGLVHTEECKARIASALRGHVKSAETRKRLSEAKIGKKLSPEHIEKMMRNMPSSKGRKHTPEARAKIAAAKLGKPGIKQSAESRQKRSESMKATIARKRAQGIEHRVCRPEWTPAQRAAQAERTRLHWATVRRRVE